MDTEALEMTFVAVLFTPIYDNLPPTFYNGRWVDKLYRGIRRNFDGNFRFVLLHDSTPFEVTEPIETMELLENLGFANLLEALRPEVASGPRFVMGLDTVIGGDITEIVRTPCDVGLIRDPHGPKRICNGVGLFSDAASAELWNELQANKKMWLERMKCRGGYTEMRFLRDFASADCALLDVLYPGNISSWRVHCRGGRRMPRDPRIVYFHGKTKPHRSRNHPWIKKHWV